MFSVQSTGAAHVFQFSRPEAVGNGGIGVVYLAAKMELRGS